MNSQNTNTNCCNRVILNDPPTIVQTSYPFIVLLCEHIALHQQFAEPHWSSATSKYLQPPIGRGGWLPFNSGRGLFKPLIRRATTNDVTTRPPTGQRRDNKHRGPLFPPFLSRGPRKHGPRFGGRRKTRQSKYLRGGWEVNKLRLGKRSNPGLDVDGAGGATVIGV